jgi:DNA-binding MarR family transcriptional regulator
MTNVFLLRQLDEDLERRHDLPLTSYDALLHLAGAPRGRLRMTDLAKRVVISPSGLTRVIDRLEREGLVVRERSDTDGRGFEAVLTKAGRKRYREAHRGHIQGVRELFLDRLTDAQLKQLRDVWVAVDPALAEARYPPPGKSSG